MSGLAPQLPLTLGESGDYSLIQTDEELVRQNLKNLLLTIPGEKTFDSSFGVGVQLFLFEPNVEVTYAEMRSRILEQVDTYMPFLDLLNISTEINEQEENAMNLTINYSIVPLDVEDSLNLLVKDLTYFK